MTSIASLDEVTTLANDLCDGIAGQVDYTHNSGKWTQAIYQTFKQIALRKRWNVYPENRCYAGEYLVDFTLFDPEYGCRVACESQWSYWRTDDQNQFDWAFDKLRGVKADIKVFIFDGDEKNWQRVEDNYLRRYAQLSSDECFLLMRYVKPGFERSWWRPETSGVQLGDIRFMKL